MNDEVDSKKEVQTMRAVTKPDYLTIDWRPMNVFKQIIRSGVSDSDDHLKARGIILSNYISLILCMSVALLFVVRWLQNGIFLSSLIVGFLLFISPVIFNRYSQTILSRLYLCYMPVAFLLYIFISNLANASAVETSM